MATGLSGTNSGLNVGVGELVGEHHRSRDLLIELREVDDGDVVASGVVTAVVGIGEEHRRNACADEAGVIAASLTEHQAEGDGGERRRLCGPLGGVDECWTTGLGTDHHRGFAQRRQQVRTLDVEIEIGDHLVERHDRVGDELVRPEQPVLFAIPEGHQYGTARRAGLGDLVGDRQCGRYARGIVGRTVADRVGRVEHSTAVAAIAEVVVVGPDDDVLVGQFAAGDHAEHVHRRTRLEIAGAARLIGEHRLRECRQLLGEIVPVPVATRRCRRRDP